MMQSEEIMAEFKDLINKNVSIPVCAMKVLVSVIKKSEGTTWMQLERELREAISMLKRCNSNDLGGRTKISLGSGCDLFMKYVTRAFLEFTDFGVCKQELIKRGENFAGISERSRLSIADIGHSFVQDGCSVLTHGNSRVVMALLLKAAESKRFSVIVTEARPSGDGREAARMFNAAGIPTTLIYDCAVGTAMETIDLCIVGAEGVMENGGIVNKLGTYQVAMIAKMTRKPFYVAVESYKFARMYPLSQRDISDLCGDITINGPPTESPIAGKYDVGAVPESGVSSVPLSGSALCASDVNHSNISLVSLDSDGGYSDSLTATTTPAIDFTPADYITLLFTDIGVLTPAAVSDELIRLYQ